MKFVGCWVTQSVASPATWSTSGSSSLSSLFGCPASTACPSAPAYVCKETRYIPATRPSCLFSTPSFFCSATNPRSSSQAGGSSRGGKELELRQRASILRPPFRPDFMSFIIDLVLANLPWEALRFLADGRVDEAELPLPVGARAHVLQLRDPGPQTAPHRGAINVSCCKLLVFAVMSSPTSKCLWKWKWKWW